MVSVKPPILIQTRYPRARRDYICHNCGDVIAKGTYHEEQVVRLGATKYKDPLEHWRMHSDCQAPWWQPWAPPKLSKLGRVPKRAGSAATDRSKHLGVFAEMNRQDLGHVLWFPPRAIAARLFHSKREDIIQLATDEAKAILALNIEALVAAAGNPKLAMQLSHRYEEIQFMIRNQEPPQKRARKPKLPKEVAS